MRLTPVIAALFVVLPLSAHAARSGVSTPDSLIAEHDCETLSADYATALDTHDTKGLAALFTEDGVWAVPNGHQTGRTAIAAFAETRKKNPYNSRHVTTNIRINVIDATHASGTAYLTIFHVDPKKGAKQDALEPALIGSFKDEFVRTAEGWRFKSRTLDSIRAMKVP